MAFKKIKGSGGEFYGETDAQEEKLQKNMLDALSTNYNASMDFMKIPGGERATFKKGGYVSSEKRKK